jgi:hypothetical protein
MILPTFRCSHILMPTLTRKGEARPQTESGKAVVLACKYHGWRYEAFQRSIIIFSDPYPSYSMKGALAKAPGFDTVPGFDPASNGLWKLRVYIDQLGFIWVNMDTYVTILVHVKYRNDNRDWL